MKKIHNSNIIYIYIYIHIHIHIHVSILGTGEENYMLMQIENFDCNYRRTKKDDCYMHIKYQAKNLEKE